ncbi:tyrosine-type recombinase/integrase [Wenzhouxiangella sp. XN79A]|uniref:tyrosine-type recombinase/integrase n=1 Tax=Wenzhouxiangella sp. XN79A TaxID=2724193 RepID=UPI00144A7343|nr:tyrosine-type recombinase/integrase [Wenzhouxiangella sp. XN79A]NKI35682.1 tyrosine-type recombinase/integrase [Wenzhouxiangella sp. XN79A]
MNRSLERMQQMLRREGVDEARTRHLLFWARGFLEHGGQDDPTQLDRDAVDRFLEHIAHERYAGRPTQDRALDAVHALYRSSPGGTPPWLQVLLDQRRRVVGPNILSREEARQLLARLAGSEWLAAALVYGTGIRLLECMRLRVRDVDPDARRLIVRDPADTVQRELPLPAAVARALVPRLDDLKQQHIQDIGNGGGAVTLPPEIAERRPDAALAWRWQYLFPARPGAARFTADTERRPIHHLAPARMHRAIEQAAHAAGIHRRVTGHVLRNSYAIHLIEQGLPVARVEMLLGIAPTSPAIAAEPTTPGCIEIPDARLRDPLVEP